MRARLAIAASGQACELREVVLRDKPQALRDASPKATVPVLVLAGGAVLEQSLDIMLWALRRRDPGGWLTPEAGGLDAMLALVGQCDTVFKHHLDRYKYPQRHGGEASDPAAHRQACGRWLLGLEALLDESAARPARPDASAQRQPFLFGTRAALADVAVMPFVRQFAQVDRTWFDGQPWPRLSAWLASWVDSELFGAIMRKHAQWIPGTPGAPFP